MTSKETILNLVRRNRPVSTELPDLNRAWTTYSDPRAKFVEVLEAVGGKVIVAHDRMDLDEQVQRLPYCSTAQRVVSLVRGVGSPNVDLEKISSPHELADVDVAILPGEFVVAENAAVWVTDRELPQRVLYFLCQHLILVVPAHAIVDHTHAAYEQIAVDRSGECAFAKPIFGAFISGPSKTADIEQSLVIGAHGARSITVCLLEE